MTKNEKARVGTFIQHVRSFQEFMRDAVERYQDRLDKSDILEDTEKGQKMFEDNYIMETAIDDLEDICNNLDDLINL